MQSRLYDFGGKGARLPGLEIPPLRHVRLLFHSRSAIRRGGRWLPRWAIFEIVDADSPGAAPQGPPGSPGAP
jgi:hypothetical protein